MSTSLLDWVHHRFGVDISGQEEFEREQRVEWLRKELENKERYASCRLQELRVELSQLMAIKSQLKKGKEMINDAVVVTSDKLYFPIPLDKYIMNTVIARNISEVPVSFKMKATDPSRYAVKPRQGTIPAFSLVEISVTLKPTTLDPAGLHDKFLLECRHLQPTITCPGCGIYATSTSASASAFQQNHSSSCCSLRIKCKFTSLLPANFQLRRVNNGEPIILSPVVSSSSSSTLQTTTTTAATSTSPTTGTPDSGGSGSGGETRGRGGGYSVSYSGSSSSSSRTTFAGSGVSASGGGQCRSSVFTATHVNSNSSVAHPYMVVPIPPPTPTSPMAMSPTLVPSTSSSAKIQESS